MREDDAPDVGQQYRQKRRAQTAYGFLLSLAGLALLVWLPVEHEWKRFAVGGLVILFGGIMIDPKAVASFAEIVGPFLPVRGGQKK